MPTRPRLLILDDDDALRETLSEVFWQAGYSISQADSAHGALAIVRKRGIDCSILDVHLPDSCGIGVFREAVQLQPKLRGILTSAAGTPALRGAAMRAGAFFFLDKPFRIEPILGLVARAVRGESRPELPAPGAPERRGLW